MDHDERTDQFARFVREGAARGMTRRAFLRRGLALGLSLPSVISALATCGLEPSAATAEPSPTPPRVATAPPAPAPTRPPATRSRPAAAPAPTAVSPTPPPPARFAVIGDYGLAGEPEQAVAALVKGWNPDFIITTGDNNYPSGAAETIDQNIGQYYHEYIGAYKGRYGPGAPTNRFFPCLGNHDLVTPGAAPYLDYFTLPPNERYYTFTQGPIQFFALNSMPGEPDGVSSTSTQARWLKEGLAASGCAWKIVYMHHPPFSSGHHGSSSWMQWPYKEWGVDVVLAGHDHSYERLLVNGLPYLVNGLGGGARYARGKDAAPGSTIFYNGSHGAMRVEATDGQLTFQFITRDGEIIDTYAMRKNCAQAEERSRRF